MKTLIRLYKADAMKNMIVIPLSKDKIIIRSTVVILILALLIAARSYNPFESELIICQFKNLTGYDCPTCGLSRSVYSLLSLNVFDSIGYHPLGSVLVLGLLAILIKFTAELIIKKEIIIPITKSYQKVIMLFTLLLVISTWILKLHNSIKDSNAVFDHNLYYCSAVRVSCGSH
jgi:hypothetical protein